jgi:hypothetical protein
MIVPMRSEIARTLNGCSGSPDTGR